MSKTYYILTFGCQMNENDSEKLAGILTEMGYEHSNDPKNCDILIINTCSVRENSDDRFFGNLGEYKSVKKKNPDMIICVCGCMMQQQIFIDEIKNKYNFVDIVFGTHNIHDFGNILTKYLSEKRKIVDVKDSSEIVENIPCKREYKHKAYVSITFGCDNFCTYCIVPYTRGREKSREAQSIIDEITSLAKDGCKEVMLLGQNVNSYGKGLNTPCTFAELLKKVSEINGIERVRFMTSHPKDFTDDIIEAMNYSEKICHNIHLPFQAGSNRILKLMNRKYTKEYYLDLVKKIKEKIPDVTLSTDIIVGFPTETEEDFNETLDIVRECRFDSAFTFIYSPRVGTKAATMEGQVDPILNKERFNKLLKVLENIISEDVKKYENTVQRVIVDGVSKSDPTVLSGRTASNKLVNFKADCKIGDTVDIKVTKVTTYYLWGEVI